MYQQNLALEARWVPENLMVAADQTEQRIASARCGCPFTTESELRTLETCLQFNEQTLRAAGLQFGEGINDVRSLIQSQQGNTSPLRDNAEYARLPELLRAAAADRERLLAPLATSQAK